MASQIAHFTCLLSYYSRCDESDGHQDEDREGQRDEAHSVTHLDTSVRRPAKKHG